MQDILNTKKFGDIAFRDSDFKNAIEYYSKVGVFLPMCHSYICCPKERTSGIH